jgi:hypothetical protein
MKMKKGERLKIEKERSFLEGKCQSLEQQVMELKALLILQNDEIGGINKFIYNGWHTINGFISNYFPLLGIVPAWYFVQRVI